MSVKAGYEYEIETTTHMQSIQLLALEVDNTFNNLKPIFMKDYFFYTKNNKSQSPNKKQTLLKFQRSEQPIMLSDLEVVKDQKSAIHFQIKSKQPKIPSN